MAPHKKKPISLSEKMHCCIIIFYLLIWFLLHCGQLLLQFWNVMIGWCNDCLQSQKFLCHCSDLLQFCFQPLKVENLMSIWSIIYFVSIRLVVHPHKAESMDIVSPELTWAWMVHQFFWRVGPTYHILAFVSERKKVSRLNRNEFWYENVDLKAYILQR